ncbi:MAG: tetratricopeptide repeat protein [Proteobacteria bacterium]|nr:tetratricopeptide repeat protein [Pseudomonadota bacterium]
MDAHEKEQIEEIKLWWRENRWFILGGLVISIAIVAGWRYWQEYRQEQSEIASQKYEELLSQARTQNFAELENTVRELQDEFSATPYAALGSMKLAAERVTAGEFAAAAEALRWAMENTDDDELALVARLRLARVLLQLGRTEDAIELLRSVEPGKFAALFEELRGDALLAKGDKDGARAAYEAAIAALEPGLGERRVLQMKLDNVAMPVEAVASTDASESGESDAQPEPGESEEE